MAKKCEIVLNSAGVKALLKSAEIKGVLDEHAQATLAGCGDRGYEIQKCVGKNRASVRVRAATAHAYYSNRKHNTLLKALK